MIVRCERIIEPRGPGGTEVISHPSIEIGGEYPVLMLYALAQRGITFRIITHDRARPTIWPATMFSIIDGAIPSLWEAHLGDDGTLYLAPPEWHAPDFWEGFFGGDVVSRERRDAIRAIYERDLTELLSMR